MRAGKTITHPLVAPDAAAPQGWRESFCEEVKDVVLPGYSAFSHADVRTAGRRLLARGAVRIKPAEALGGRGQYVARDSAALDDVVDALDSTALARSGAVLEENLREVRTCSVGQVRVGLTCVSYHGTQKLTSDSTGQAVYGGSDLTVVPGDFDALLARALAPAQALAVKHGSHVRPRCASKTNGSTRPSSPRRDACQGCCSCMVGAAASNSISPAHARSRHSAACA